MPESISYAEDLFGLTDFLFSPGHAADTTTVQAWNLSPDTSMPAMENLSIMAEAPASSGWDELMPVVLAPPEEVARNNFVALEHWYWKICIANPDCPWELELNEHGELEIMPPPSPPGDEYEGGLYFALESWNRSQGNPGIATGPTGAYRLPSGAVRIPDAAWAPDSVVRRLAGDSPHARYYVPEFVAEIRSRSDRLARLLDKMQAYKAAGVRLGWLIDPGERNVRVYRAGEEKPELHRNSASLDGEDVLPGFRFSVRSAIFDLKRR